MTQNESHPGLAPFLLSTLLGASLLASATVADADVAATGRARFDRMIAIEAKPGMPSIETVTIDWCDLVNLEYPSGGALARQLTQMEDRGWYWQHVPQVATLLCGAPDDPQYKRQAAYFVQGLVNLTGQSQEQVVKDLKSRLAETKWNQEREQTCKNYEASPQASEEEQDLLSAHRETFGCGRDPEPAWWLNKASTSIGAHLDRVAERPSQVLLAYHVINCLSTASNDAYSAVAYAMCSQDIDALDDQVLAKEMQRGGYNEYARAIAGQHVRYAATRGAALAEKVRALAAKNPAYKTLAFDAPAAARSRWQELSSQNAKALSAAALYEERFVGPSRSAARACSSELREHFRNYVRAQKPLDPEQVKLAATDPVGILLLTRLAGCEAMEGNAHAAVMLYLLAKEGRNSRGPRAAVLNALIDALNVIREDQPRFPVEFNVLPRPQTMSMLDETYRIASGKVTVMQAHAGAVENVKKAGSGSIVTFATVSWVEDNWQCRDTNKVFKIESNGQVQYHKSCKKIGKRTVKKTPPTIWVPNSYAAGLKKGAFIEFDYDLERTEGHFIALVRSAYKSKKKKKLTAAFGVPL